MNPIRSFNGIMPTLGNNVYIDQSSAVIGEINIGDDSSIWPCVAARGDVNNISIGKRTNIQDGSVLHVTHKRPDFPEGYPLIIGDDVTVGHNVTLHGCILGDRILVGIGAIILDGAVIENEVMIGAGSLVPPRKILESGYLYVGSPVKQIRPLTTQERNFLKTSADNYVNYKNIYLKEE